MSEIPNKSRTIGKHEYRSRMMPLGEWFDLEELVVDALGGPLEKLFGAMPQLTTGKFDLEDLQTEAIAEALHGLLRGLGSKRLSRLVDNMAGYCHRLCGRQEHKESETRPQCMFY